MANDNLINKNNVDFIEEDNKLKRLVSEIQYLLSNYQKFSPYPEVSMYDTASDYDEAEEIHYKKNSNQAYYDRTIVPWKEKLDSPYYGRIDLDINGDFKSVYIGEKDLHDKDGNLVVFSGYSEVGRFFAQRSFFSTNNCC